MLTWQQMERRDPSDSPFQGEWAAVSLTRCSEKRSGELAPEGSGSQLLAGISVRLWCLGVTHRVDAEHGAFPSPCEWTDRLLQNWLHCMWSTKLWQRLFMGLANCLWWEHWKIPCTRVHLSRELSACEVTCDREASLTQMPSCGKSLPAAAAGRRQLHRQQSWQPDVPLAVLQRRCLLCWRVPLKAIFLWLIFGPQLFAYCYELRGRKSIFVNTSWELSLACAFCGGDMRFWALMEPCSLQR